MRPARRPPLLDASIVVDRGALTVAVDVAVRRGETSAVVGPNGAGKTTLLRALGGLEPSSRGPVRIDGVDQSDRPASERPVQMVFQELRLFPHLDGVDNVAFPLRAAGWARAAARTTAAALLASLDIDAAVAARRPDALSGGEAQRVALARALVVEPTVLLLDEPFAALDAAARPAARTVVRERLARFGGATVMVTHDPADAVVLADRVMVLEDGAVTQTGSVAEIARAPLTPYAARLVGTNLLFGHSDGAKLTTAGGLVVATAEPVPVGPAGIVVPPMAVALYADPPVGSARNVWRARIEAVEVLGSRARITVRTEQAAVTEFGATAGGDELVAEVTLAAVEALALEAGAIVFAAVKATEIEVVASGRDAGAVSLTR